MTVDRRRLLKAGLAASGAALFAPAVLAQAKTKITMTQATDSLSFMPAFLPRALHFFEDEGLDVTVVVTGGDGPDVQAVVSGDAQFACSSSAPLLKLYQQGKKLWGIAGVLGRLTNNVCIRKDAAAARGVTETSSFEDKLKALKGLKMGVSIPGSLTYNIAMHYILRAGLKPQVDTQILAMGAGAAAIAAIERNVVDAYIFGSPLIEEMIYRGSSIMLINNARGDDPEFKEFLQETLYVRPDYAKANPDITKRMTRAIVRSSAWIAEHSPEEIAKALQPYFGRLAPEVLIPAIANVKLAMIRTGRITLAAAKAAEKFYIENGTIKQPIPYDEIYTDAYLPA